MSAPSVNPRRGYEYQAHAVIDQAAPIQNQWYPVLDITNVSGLLKHIFLGILVAAEDLESEITIDGVNIGTPAALTVGIANDAEVFLDYHVNTSTVRPTLIAINARNRALDLPFKTSLLIRVRKITANGAGNLRAAVVHHIQT